MNTWLQPRFAGFGAYIRQHVLACRNVSFEAALLVNVYARQHFIQSNPNPLLRSYPIITERLFYGAARLVVGEVLTETLRLVRFYPSNLVAISRFAWYLCGTLCSK